MGLHSDVINRLDALKAERQKFEPVWKEIAERMDPFSAILEGRMGDISKIQASQPLRDLDTFTSASISLVMPRGSMWHGLEPVDEALAERDDVKVWSEAVTKRLFSVRYMPETGFVANVNRIWRSLGAYGTQVLMSEEVLERGPGGTELPPLRYRMIPLKECYLTTTSWGAFDGFYREYKLTVRQIVNEFGSDNLPDNIRSRLDRPETLEQKLTIVHAIDPNLKDIRSNLPWPSVHVLKGHRKILRQSGYYQFPIHASTFAEQAGYAYGWGPGMLALPDVKQLNIMTKTTMRAAEQAVSPAWATMEKLKKRLNLSGNAINHQLLTPEGKLKAQPLHTGARPDIGEAMMEQKAQEISASFYGHLWQILVNKPDMTAYEAALRAQEKGDLIGPPFAKQEEMLASLVRRELAILERQAAEGLIDLPPRPRVLEGQEITLKFTSPLAKLRRSGEAVGIRRSIEAATQIGSFDPSVFDNIDGDEAYRTLSDIEGAPAKVLRPREAVQQRREARAAQQQQEQATGQEQADIEAAAKAAPLIDAMTRARDV